MSAELMPEQVVTPDAPFVGTIRIPLEKNPLSLNDRKHWRAKAAETKKWRLFAALKAARFPRLSACDVTLTWFVNDRRRRDEDNLYPLLKALCDGLVDAGVTDDDTAQYMGKACRIVTITQIGVPAHMELRVVSRGPAEDVTP